ncbi:hypothetical protein CLV24_101365 [Pontibacter ummariensis]|uniref:DUF3221 domain-containing protein n=1 Tax=Pontibacter ummariensis TaxID=1610492 RepID=A0A239BEW6_9BACT|nr:hypothetical protein [Pontibacter ummariensis]PRY16519.1 hypothetical protein CLV24_101365 [Pontibacter ummariensis]SNS06597.1 hypothetical protein SAMN06296052_101365 [Pontibacter ummariensis]
MITKPIKISYWYLILLLLACACGGDEPKRIPTTLPDVHGSVSEVERSAKIDAILATVQVKAMEGIAADYPAAIIRIDENTLLENATGEELPLAQVRVGSEVHIWFEEGILESPMEGYAKAVRVLD